MSYRAKCTLDYVDNVVTNVLMDEIPVGVPVEVVKWELAQHWLGLPRGFWARLWWAFQFARRRA
jgi:hypothetical protein